MKTKTSTVNAVNKKPFMLKLTITIGFSVLLAPYFITQMQIEQIKSDSAKTIENMKMQIEQIKSDNAKTAGNVQMEFKQIKQDQQATILSVNQVIPAVNNLVMLTKNNAHRIDSLHSMGMGTGNITTQGCTFTNCEHAIESQVFLK